jgi:hypothetical protein
VRVQAAKHWGCLRRECCKDMALGGVLMESSFAASSSLRFYFSTHRRDVSAYMTGLEFAIYFFPFVRARVCSAYHQVPDGHALGWKH